MDLFDKLSEDLAVMERFLALPLGKFLELGTDQLLMVYFPGGGSTSAGDTREAWECNEQEGTGTSSSSAKRSRSPKYAERALDVADLRVEASVKEFETEVKATIAEKVRWFPVDAISVSVRVMLLTPTAIDKA